MIKKRGGVIGMEGLFLYSNGCVFIYFNSCILMFCLGLLIEIELYSPQMNLLPNNDLVEEIMLCYILECVYVSFPRFCVVKARVFLMIGI